MQPTGLTTYALNLLPHLRAGRPELLIAQPLPGYACHVVSSQLTPDLGTRGHLSRLLWTQTTLPRIFRQYRSRLLFCPMPEAPLFSQVPFVVTVHDCIPLRFPQPFSLLTLYFRWVLPQILHRAAHIICDSESTASDIMKFYDLPASQITPIPLAHDAQRFYSQNLPRRNYFLCLARHDPHKNLLRILQAFQAIPDAYELWIAGPPVQRYTADLHRLAKELGLTQRVKFLDYVPQAELPALIEQARALIFPSLWEGFGLPVLEAMACGTPVITSNVSSLPEVAGDAALLVDPYQVSEISEAMLEIIKDPALACHLSQAGCLRASQFSWEKTGQATTAVLQRFM